VTEGLKVGDKVVVDGVAKVKEGQEVSAKPYQPASKQHHKVRMLLQKHKSSCQFKLN
jgi:hypothetical protein